jgi:hypothetical protein
MASISPAGSASAGCPAGGLEQARNGGSVSGSASSSRIGKIGRRSSSFWRQVADQGDLHFGANPAPHAVAPGEHDERRTALQDLLQALQPAVAATQRSVILEDTQLRPVRAPRARQLPPFGRCGCS